MSLFGGEHKIDNRLQERSKLIFEFPTNESNSTLDRVCPFFENPVITEKKVINLIKYDVLGRTSNFLAYTGAKSKQYSVTFNMTLANIVHMATNELFTQPPSPKTKKQKQKDFFESKTPRNVNGVLTLPESVITAPEQPGMYESTYSRKRTAFMKKVNGGLSIADAAGDAISSAKAIFTNPALGTSLGGAISTGLQNYADSTTPEADLAADLRAYRKDTVQSQALDIMLFWISLIRMSALTSRQQPTLGPPIIRLIHGVLDDNIATVIESYSLSINEEAGYDIVTLLPQQVKITLNLLEIQRDRDPRNMTEVTHLDEMKGWDDLLLSEDPRFY